MSCNNKKDNKTPIILWAEYIQAHPEYSDDPMPEVEFFHNNKSDANRLGQLVLKGKKSASSSVYALYKKYNMDLPKIGKRQIVTDFDGNALAIITTIGVDTIPFNKISADYAALDMGTNKEPLEKWKKAHWIFFDSFLSEIDEKATEDMRIVCERFKTVWPEKQQ